MFTTDPIKKKIFFNLHVVASMEIEPLGPEGQLYLLFYLGEKKVKFRLLTCKLTVE